MKERKHGNKQYILYKGEVYEKSDWPTFVVAAIVFVLLMILCFLPRDAEAQEKVYFVKSETIRHVTAYNVGDTKQTDDTPCIGAANTNLCEALERGEKHCAANFVPLGTKLHIDKVGVCVVTDRMNRRYRNRVDIAMEKHEYKKALNFGRQKLMVRILREVD